MKAFIKFAIFASALTFVQANKLVPSKQEIQPLELAQKEVFVYDEPITTELAQKTTVVTSGGSSDDDPYGIGGFIVGCFMIPFSLVLLWKNEKKIVTYAKLI